MKLRFEDVAAFDELTDIPAEALSPEAEARITAMTMKQITPKRRKPLRYVAAAAAVVAALGVTTFAAAERGWFGFDRFFGGSTEAVAEHVRNYGETEEAVTGRQAEAAVAPYVRTPEQERGIAEGYLFMPDSAQVDPATATAETDNYTYTLESMLASPDTLLAVVRVDAKSDEAAAFLRLTEADAFENNTGFFMFTVGKVVEYEPTHNFEYQNGGMNWEILRTEGNSATFLLSNTGGQFEVGDTIRFEAGEGDRANYYVFETPLTDVMEDHVDIIPDRNPDVQSLKLTPISLQLRMVYDYTAENSGSQWPDVGVRLKDGTEFSMANLNNGFATAPYGTYGSFCPCTALSMDLVNDPWEEITWAFSRIVDLEEIEAVTVGGEEYPVP